MLNIKSGLSGYGNIIPAENRKGETGMKKKENADRSTEILIVEDSITQARVLSSMIEKNGFKPRVAQNGKEALALLKKHIPDIIISDIVMPEMNGYELCNEVKSDQKLKHIPVMLLTSLSDSEDVIKGLTCGADNFFTKPYSEEILLSRIRFILANRELRKERFSEMGINIIFGGGRSI